MPWYLFCAMLPLGTIVCTISSSVAAMIVGGTYTALQVGCLIAVIKNRKKIF